VYNNLWQTYPIKYSASNGRDIEATIFYSAKNYYIEIHGPIKFKFNGPHIVSELPAKYVLTFDECDLSGIQQIPILEDCKNRIIGYFTP